MNRLSIWTPERHSELVRLFEEQVSTAQIARRMGLTKGQVVGRMNRTGLGEYQGPSRPKHWCLWCGKTLRERQFCNKECAEKYTSDIEKERLSRKSADVVVGLWR